MNLTVWASRKTGKFVVTDYSGAEFIATLERDETGTLFVSKGWLSEDEKRACIRAIALGTIREAEPLKATD